MIGITSTIAQEIVWSSGEKLVDLNNLFVEGDSAHYIDIAERNGFPGNICSWIKGMYGVIKEHKITKVIGVTEGDCSTTKGLMEILAQEGIEVIPFSFPHDRDYTKLQQEFTKLIDYLNTDWLSVNTKFQELNRIRNSLQELDILAGKGVISSKDLYLWQVTSSDFGGDPERYHQQLREYLVTKEIIKKSKSINLGYLGVPPIQPEVIDIVEELGGRINFFEVPRQFCLIPSQEDIVKAYQEYTYPYDISQRLVDIKQQLKKRNIKGLINYTQSFCFRQIEDIIFKRELDIPILTLELDRPGIVDTRTRLRLESFIESLS